jgi:hypothetical protein
VNPGRAPTRIGGDGIDPFLDLPHWMAQEFKRCLRHHRIRYKIIDFYVQRCGSDDPDEHSDRFYFPGSDPRAIQMIVDGLSRDL